MSDQSYTATMLVDQAPEEAFAAINNVRGWWSEEIEGPTDEPGGEFAYHFEDVHRCKMRSVCSHAWGGYITGRLKSLITTGTGSPNNAIKNAEALKQRG